MSRFHFEMDFTGVKRLKPDDDYKDWRGCKGKVQFRCLKDAEEARARMSNWAELNSYLCNNCGGAHIGHKRKGTR